MTYDPAYAKRWRLDAHRGITRTIDACAVREHVCQLLLEGASVRGIGEAAGVAASVVSRLRNGQQARLRRDVATRLTRVTMQSIRARGNGAGFVPNLGARRRIQGLLALGHRHTDITAAMGAVGTTSQMVLHQRGDWIARETHDAVLTAYAVLAARPGPSQRTRNRAAKAGYAPPAAWEDEALDDPLACPAENAVRSIADSRPAVHLDDVAWLVETGATWHSLPERLGVTKDAIEKACYRAERRDLLEQLTRNTKREVAA